MTRLVAVVTEGSREGMVEEASRALEAGADLVEFRLDYLTQASLPDAPDLAKELGPRAIATLRSQGEGGASSLPIGDRMRTLRELAQSGFAYIDVELRGDAPILGKLREIARAAGTGIIASVHPSGFPGPHEVERLLRSACSVADIGKIAVEVPAVGRTLELMQTAKALKAEGQHFCLVAMGDGGALTRVHARIMGSEFNYVVPRGGRATAMGQLGLERSLLLAGSKPILLGLIGQPVDRSPSPAMQTAALDYLGIPGIYLPLPTPPEELGSVIGVLAELGLRGVNVTAPHKVAVLSHLDAVDPEAARVGAVNTIIVDPDGRLVGHNTDAHGFRALLAEAAVEAVDRSVLLLGAGGGARAAAHVLVALGARVTVYNRSPARAKAMVASSPGVQMALTPTDLEGPWDIVVNCTPPDSGAFGESPGSVFQPGAIAIDLAYDPMPTPFLQAAHRRGCRPVGGLGMLVHQGGRALELWIGKSAPLEAMRRAAVEALG